MVCSGMRNLSIKHSFVNTLCYSVIFSFVSHSQQVGIILFLVFSLVVAFAANYSLASAARLEGEGTDPLSFLSKQYAVESPILQIRTR
jgi:hypothetical protein